MSYERKPRHNDSRRDDGRVVKVLPLFLDLKGHDAISPSLFDRDAYQVFCASTPMKFRHPLRCLVEGVNAKGAKLKLRAELRGWRTRPAAPDRPGNGSHARIFPQLDFAETGRR